MSRKFAVVTTFNQKGLLTYGQRMINSYIQNWPDEVDFYIYAERCNPSIPKSNKNIHVLDLEKNSPDLVEFKKKWGNVPKANGQGPDKKRLDASKAFKWDAIRFCHKVYAIFDCARKTDADVLIWMDADTYCHSPMTYNFLNDFVKETAAVCYFNRDPKWPECGWYSMNLKDSVCQDFLKRFEDVWNNAEEGIFTMKEWHDSFVFYEIVKEFRNKPGWSEHSLSNVTISGEGHPIVNSAIGAYIDHMKGDRKLQGHSNRKDLKIQRHEDYWKNK
jgi:hypothetical protein